MSKPRKKQGNPDFRHWVNCPAPTNEEIESRLIELFTPGTFANLKDVKDKERSLRSRLLTLPVMAAIVLSLVYRQVQHLTFDTLTEQGKYILTRQKALIPISSSTANFEWF